MRYKNADPDRVYKSGYQHNKRVTALSNVSRDNLVKQGFKLVDTIRVIRRSTNGPFSLKVYRRIINNLSTGVVTQEYVEAWTDGTIQNRYTTEQRSA
jgi:type II secretory pathway component PulF